MGSRLWEGLQIEGRFCRGVGGDGGGGGGGRGEDGAGQGAFQRI